MFPDPVKNEFVNIGVMPARSGAAGDGDGGGLTRELVAGAMRGRREAEISRWLESLERGVCGNGGTSAEECACLEESLSNCSAVDGGEGVSGGERASPGLSS